MKQALKIIFAGTLLFTFAIASLRAQTNAAGETSNSMASESQAATNAPAFVAKDKPQETDSDAVVIDNTGIHMGGTDGVNISWGNDYGSLSKTLNAVVSRVLVVVLLVVSVTMFVVSLAVRAPFFFFALRHWRMTNETLRTMIEKGTPITPEVAAILNPRPHLRPRCVCVPGLILTLIGVGLVDDDHGFGGWIVVIIGIAFLLNSCSASHIIPDIVSTLIPDPRCRPRFVTGLILTLVGVGLVNGDHSFGGWIVVMTGIAFLVVWLIESRKSNDPSSQNSGPASQPPKL